MAKSVARWVCARPRAAFDYGKKLAANERWFMQGDNLH